MLSPPVIMVLLFFVQKGELLKAEFRVNAHNRLEVCSTTCFGSVHCDCMQLIMTCEVLSFYLFFNVRPIARSMASKQIFSLATWWLKIEL